MEFEHDKEIDALLRRTRFGESPPGETAEHLDADVIAAFAENALPDKVRLRYLPHLADCGRCRTMLADVIAMNSEDAPAPEPAGAPIAAAETSVPWYRRLAAFPNLAYVMGGLVLIFSGLIGYTALQNMGGAATDISRSMPAEAQTGNYSANTANLASSSANAASMANMPAATANYSETNTGGALQASPPEKRAAADVQRDEQKTAAANPAAAETFTADTAGPPPPPPAIPADKANERIDAAAVPPRRADEQEVAAMERRTEAMPEKSRTLQLKTAPGRSAEPASRQAGGKTFSLRDGAWYDSAYNNQPTTNIRRGTAEYKSLDAGLRSIADEIGGTVVIVWNEKAYRIR